MRKGSAIVGVAISAALFLGACGDSEPSNADRPEESDTVPEPEVEGRVIEATPTAVVITAAPAQLNYTVQSGDTLGAIASNFGVSVADLMDANEIGDADVISIGLDLVIPEPSEQSEE